MQYRDCRGDSLLPVHGDKELMRNYELRSAPGFADRYKTTGISLVAIGDAAHDRATQWAKFQFPSHLLVKNVADMVNKVIHQCQQMSAKMNCLIIIGHGAPGQQQVGYAGEGGDILDIASIVGAHYERSHHRRKLVFKHVPDGKLRADLGRLTPYFAPGAQVILGGCDVGEEPEVARALAQLLHVRVTAYCAQQVIPLPSIWVGDEVSFNSNGGLQKGVTSNLPFHVR